MDNCAISVAVTKNECKAVVKRCIKPFVAWCTNAELNGIAGHGEEPPIFIKKLLGCGDMCYQQKMTATGGVYKVKRFVCLYCESDGDLDMFCIVSGTDRC